MLVTQRIKDEYNVKSGYQITDHCEVNTKCATIDEDSGQIELSGSLPNSTI